MAFFLPGVDEHKLVTVLAVLSFLVAARCFQPSLFVQKAFNSPYFRIAFMYFYAFYATRDYKTAAIGVGVLLLLNNLSKTTNERRTTTLF
jgi:hypothetical protein